MITVHHLEYSRSQRVLWLLEELELDYEIVRYARDRKTSLAPPELTEVHPLGKSPVITDGEVTVAESGAIVEYIIGRYGEGRLKPPPRVPRRTGGTCTGADIQMSFPVEGAAARGGLGSRPRLRSFLDRVHERAAYRRALERGGPLQILG